MYLLVASALLIQLGSTLTGAWRASQPRLQFTHSGKSHMCFQHASDRLLHQSFSPHTPTHTQVEWLTPFPLIFLLSLFIYLTDYGKVFSFFFPHDWLKPPSAVSLIHSEALSADPDHHSSLRHFQTCPHNLQTKTHHGIIILLCFFFKNWLNISETDQIG